MAPAEWCATETSWKRNGSMSPYSRVSTTSSGSLLLSRQWAKPRSTKPDTALEAAILRLLALEHSGQQLVVVRVVPGVLGLAAVAEPIERRQGEVEFSGPDQLRHHAVEEGDQQRGDVGAVDVGVGHDHHSLVAQRFVPV